MPFRRVAAHVSGRWPEPPALVHQTRGLRTAGPLTSATGLWVVVGLFRVALPDRTAERGRGRFLVRGFVLKRARPEELMAAVRTVARTEALVCHLGDGAQGVTDT
jgi:hypothetical protein